MSLEITQELIARQSPEAQEIIHSLLSVIQKLEQRLDQLEKQNAKHLKRITELEDRLKMTPQNSSVPPSSVHPHAKPASTKSQPKSKKKRGGQKGHKKHKRELVPLDRVNQIVPLKPSACRRYGEKLIGEDSSPIRHQVFELPEIKPLIIEYQRHRLVCPGCGESTCATLPEGVPEHQSGPRLSAFVSLLMAHYRQCKRRTALFLESVLNIPCSTGLVVKLQNRATQSLRPIYDQLVLQLPTRTKLN
ncbi:MAG: IS66 family transposase zinc-finger binding domain-containing protein [Planctomycetaceae bacterium]|nr:IS66 family transposase zinc-finger binding domain-containing protein [Planctomycetaceae bacterium]